MVVIAATAMHAVAAAGGERLSKATVCGEATGAASSSMHLLASLIGTSGSVLRAACIQRQQRSLPHDPAGNPASSISVATLMAPFCSAVSTSGCAVMQHMLRLDATATASNPGGPDGMSFLSEMLQLVLYIDGEISASGFLLNPYNSMAAKALMRGARMAGTQAVPLTCISALVGALISLQHHSNVTASKEERRQNVSEPSAMQLAESSLVSALFDALATLSEDSRQHIL